MTYLKWMIGLLLMLGLGSCQEEINEGRLIVPATITFDEDLIHYTDEDIPSLKEGVIVSHNYYENLEDLLIIDSSRVNWDTQGIYQINYYVTTPFQVTTKAVRDVTVLEGREEALKIYPAIIGLKDMTYYIGDDIPNYLEDIVAFDLNDGYITDQLIIDDTSVDYDTVGTYQVRYSVMNSQTLITTETITITVLQPVISSDTELHVLYINDTHGAILEDGNQMGLVNIASYVDYVESHEDHVLFISGGDLLQGSLLSNYFYGAPIIEALNFMNHEAFTLGNHEFDWGLDIILDYFTGNHDIQANYPLLAANVFYSNTETQPEGIQPYTIVTRGDLRIGIIGTIGYGLESSIATSRVTGYEFRDPVTYVSYYANYLRTNEDIDLVFAIDHGARSDTNQGIGNLTGSSRVDAMFNGHTHQNSLTFISRDGLDMPVMQSAAYGQVVGHLTLDISRNGLENYQAQNLGFNQMPNNMTINLEIEALIEAYYDEVEPLITNVILPSSSYYSRNDLTQYMAKLMALKTNAVVGIHNGGGTRMDLSYNEGITVAKLYEIFPFDNRIKTVYLKGSVIQALINSFSSSEVFILNNMTFDDDEDYLVATNDYLFDKETLPFLSGTGMMDTGLYIRDIFLSVVETQAEIYSSFSMTYDIVFPLGAWLTILDLRRYDGTFL
ncbi:MAG: 5'-nucleotidase C-terminal domain-containing protein [Acholeplasmataceae bacterium]